MQTDGNGGMAKFKEDIRNRVDVLIERSGIGSRRQLSKQMKISEDMLSKLLRGERSWKIIHLIQIARALGVSLEDLFSNVGQETIPLFTLPPGRCEISEALFAPVHEGRRIQRIAVADYAVEFMEEFPYIPAHGVLFFRRNYDGLLRSGDVVSHVDDMGVACLRYVRPAGALMVLAALAPGHQDVIWRPGSRPIDLRVAAVHRPEKMIIGG